MCFSPETVPLFTSSTNSLQYFCFPLTLRFEWTDHCAFSLNTQYSKYDSLKANLKG